MKERLLRAAQVLQHNSSVFYRVPLLLSYSGFLSGHRFTAHDFLQKFYTNLQDMSIFPSWIFMTSVFPVQSLLWTFPEKLFCIWRQKPDQMPLSEPFSPRAWRSSATSLQPLSFRTFSLLTCCMWTVRAFREEPSRSFQERSRTSSWVRNGSRVPVGGANLSVMAWGRDGKQQCGGSVWSLTQLHHVRGGQVAVAQTEALAVWSFAELLDEPLDATPSHHRGDLGIIADLWGWR